MVSSGLIQSHGTGHWFSLRSHTPFRCETMRPSGGGTTATTFPAAGDTTRNRGAT